MTVYNALPAEQFRTSQRIWLALAAITALDAGWLWKEHMSLDISHALIFFPVVAACFSISMIYRYLRRDDCLYMLGNIANQMLGAAALIGVLSYVSARTNYPLVDRELVAVDHWLWFDWREYVAWVDGVPWLAIGLSYAYTSSGPQMIVILFLLFLYKDIAQAQRFIVAFIISALIVVLFSTLYPAMGAYIYFHFEPSQFHLIRPAAGYIHAKPLMEMRDHSVDVLTFPLKGLVTFPSFHSALSILLIYVSLPIRWLSFIIIPLNLLILMSTPADGGHYLTDIIAGVIIGVLVAMAVEKIVPRRSLR